MWNPDSYLQAMQAQCKPELAFGAKSAEEMGEWQTRLRERFVSLLGGFPIDSVPLDPVLLESTDCGEYTRQRVEISTFAGLRMPFYLLIPKPLDKKTRRPAVIACHGHGYGGKEIIGLNPDGTENTGDPGYQKNFALKLVRAGYVTVVPELLGFGDRKLAEDADHYSSCHRISTFLLAIGRTMAGTRVYETLRCIDYLQTLPEVDGNRIGYMGISGGGLVAAFAAALDQRVGAVVVSGYLNTFEASILSVHHCVDNYVPGLSLLAEMPDLFGLIAPRPLLIESGIKDPMFPIDATRQAFRQLESMYRLSGGFEKLDLDVFDRDHEISGAMAYDWFDRL